MPVRSMSTSKVLTFPPGKRWKSYEQSSEHGRGSRRRGDLATGCPSFGVRGKQLVFIAGYAKHAGFDPMPTTIEAFQGGVAALTDRPRARCDSLLGRSLCRWI